MDFGAVRGRRRGLLESRCRSEPSGLPDGGVLNAELLKIGAVLAGVVAQFVEGGPEALHPKWSAYLKGRDFSRVASLELKFPLSVVLFHRTRGKVVGDASFDSVSIVDVSSRLTKSIKQNLARLIQKKLAQIKMASSQRLLILVEVSEWEIKHVSAANYNVINFSAKVKMKEIDEKGKEVSDDQFQTMEWVTYDRGLYEDKVLDDLIDEVAVEIAKKLLEINFSVN